MKLQELINNSELDLSISQLKAFFLGTLSADRPMNFDKAITELVEDEMSGELKIEMKTLWESLASKRTDELKKLFTKELDQETTKDQMDFFLTALSLSGTNSETTKDADVAEILEELEDLVMEMDEAIIEGDQSQVEEIKEVMLEVWKDFVLTRQ
jgi:hypothetical protein